MGDLQLSLGRSRSWAGKPGASLRAPLAPHAKSWPGAGEAEVCPGPRAAQNRGTWTSHPPGQERSGQPGPRPTREKGTLSARALGVQDGASEGARVPLGALPRGRGPRSRARGTSRRPGSRSADGVGGAGLRAGLGAGPRAPGPAAEGRGPGLPGVRLRDGPVARRRGLGELEALPSGFPQ